MIRLGNRIRAAVAIVALAAGLPAVAEAQTRVNSGFNLFSAQQDAEIGAQSAAQADRQLRLVGGSAQQYVDQIGQRLAAAAPGPRFNYRFRVVDSTELNAFALPGGYVYVNRGVLQAAHSDGEVAGVLAHEIAHVALRHGTHNASKAYVTQAGLSVLGGLLGGRVGNNTAQVLNVVGGLGLNATFLKYSRDAESQADIAGAQIMSRAGFNSYEMVSFFRTLEQADHRKTVNWLSDHPAPASRIQRIQREASLLGARPTSGVRSASLSRVQSSLGGRSSSYGRVGAAVR